MRSKKINLFTRIVHYDMISDSKGSRVFYDKLICNKTVPKVLEFWNNIFQQNINWKDVFIFYRQCTNDCKLLDFQYKFIFRIIFTKRELLKMKLVDNDKCTFCKHASEDISHVYFDCEFVKRFWQDLEMFINNHLHCNIILTKFDITFGISSHNKILNHMILLAKRFIYVSSIRQHVLSSEEFLKYLKMTCSIEKFISRKNNRFEVFIRKWNQLPMILGIE